MVGEMRFVMAGLTHTGTETGTETDAKGTKYPTYRTLIRQRRSGAVAAAGERDARGTT